MYHFVAFIWDHADASAVTTSVQLSELLRSSKSHLKIIFSTPGMTVFGAPPNDAAMRPYVLARNRGVVLGCLFPAVRSAGSASATVTEHDFDGSTADVRQLARDYWGAYVAFLRSSETGHSYVVRDCSGWLPCYRTRHRQVEIVFADLTDLAELRLPRFNLNLQYLAAYVYDGMLQVRECGIAEVTEVLAGECVEIRETAIKQYALWNPAEIVRQRSFDDFAGAEAELTLITQGCINAWASKYQNILLSLSGGLDSAIVLGCLKRALVRPHITCFNQCTENTADDERRYARIAASQANIQLLECPWAAPIFDEGLFSIPKAPKPYPGDIFWWLEQQARNELAARTQAEAIWTGQGGDHLFWAFTQFPITADYLARRGIDRRLLNTVCDDARLSRRSYLSVLRTAISLSRSSGPWTPDVERAAKGHFVNADALPENYLAYLAHPWTLDLAGLPKAKQVQIRLLADVLNRHRHMPRAETAYQRHPLLSQPLIDLCLQIPSYVLVQGGRRRALARAAFSDRVPHEIIARDDKGETSQRVRAMIRHNEKFLRDLLLDGVLVSERIVSRGQLQAILVEGQSYRPDNIWALLSCISAEIWVQTWKGAVLKLAA